MKLLIFGATGSIGRLLVEQALEQGHIVTAFVRDPAKLESQNHPNLRISQGDVLNLPSVEKAVRGQDVVLCALGAGRKGFTRAEGTRNILQAMEATGVKRLICQTTLGAGDSKGNLNFFWKYIMFGLLLRKAFADHEQQERYVQKSPLDWIMVRPAAFTDGPRTGQYRHGFPDSADGLTLKISRADVADFMLKQLTDDTYHRKTPGLSY
ncbi:SDR family oxidoreductase [Spirosoma sp. BT702]|uniref:SDR family oxidoreductase n=1 Tax=Spirosoma profusum TaxID=2771354 RepID=A0A926Y3B6_9BACT|nr:SDR family oxidoreductase [Spirosoma profusum]MBD2701631.1 SDR family oxidoreductase [Spirosoma profusum]